MSLKEEDRRILVELELDKADKTFRQGHKRDGSFCVPAKIIEIRQASFSRERGLEVTKTECK